MYDSHTPLTAILSVHDTSNRERQNIYREQGTLVQGTYIVKYSLDLLLACASIRTSDDDRNRLQTYECNGINSRPKCT